MHVKSKYPIGVSKMVIIIQKSINGKFIISSGMSQMNSRRDKVIEYDFTGTCHIDILWIFSNSLLQLQINRTDSNMVNFLKKEFVLL